MKATILSIALLALFISPATSFSGADSKDPSVVNGTWITKKAVYDGQQVQISGMFVPVKMAFEDGKFKMWTSETEFYGSYTVDTSKSPNWITIAYDGNTEKPFQGSSFRGLFEVKDDSLTLVTNVQRRPRELNADKFSLNTMLVFDRKEEESGKSESESN